MNKMIFTKMHGNGNDFIVIEDLEEKIKDISELSRKLCNRNFGIGGDGLLIVRKSSIADIQMIIINSDGSYAAMCGNGIRCFAKYVWEHKLVENDVINIETGDGIKTAYLEIVDNEVLNVTINMGNPVFIPGLIPALSEEEIIERNIIISNKEYKINTLLMGVPHTVLLGKLSDFNVEEGKHIEKYRLFPQGTNVNFCEVVDKNNIKVKTWERGAGPTLACGTGSCASVVVANKLGLTGKKVLVQIPGGNLIIELTTDGVLMTGPAVNVFRGKISL